MSDILAVTYDDSIPVTPSDTTADPAGPFAGLHTGSGGNITVTTIRGRKVLFTACAAGTVLQQAVSQVWITGTAATGIVGMIALPWKGKG